ncbi:MAG: ABC transporter ATP-binding protein [Oscillospiraceae bacterium]|jgi:putative ABC transport system ATP-binding protein|nr:ABC transporter ATP-binding protein [Oscillospiraceae bacterium]
MSTLLIENVTYKYRNSTTAAVKSASCAFEPGRLYAIIGPSGSGKSTLLSMLAGLDLPSEGKVQYGGKSLADMDLDRYRREDISMIFQAFQLFPLLTVLENVCYPMELTGISPKDARPRAQELLLRVGITQEQMKRFPSHLSGGEQQRVAIARSLASGAKTFLADEPTGNLDVANTDNIMEILRSLAREGYCVIVVTHDAEVAAAADSVYRMTDGVLTAE